MHGYLSLDIICSSKLTVFLELRSRKAVRFLEQIMSADKFPCIFSRQLYIFAPNGGYCLYSRWQKLKRGPIRPKGQVNLGRSGEMLRRKILKCRLPKTRFHAFFCILHDPKIRCNKERCFTFPNTTFLKLLSL